MRLNLITPAFQLAPRRLGCGTLKFSGFIELKPEISPREHAHNQRKRVTPIQPRVVKQAVWREAGYSGEELRAIRARKGVGRPPAFTALNGFLKQYGSGASHPVYFEDGKVTAVRAAA